MTTKQKSEIKRNIRQASKVAFAEAERLSKSGGISSDCKFFAIALTHLGLKEAAATFRPLSYDGRREVKNLECF